jgi:hypothetical protein
MTRAIIAWLKGNLTDAANGPLRQLRPVAMNVTVMRTRQ